MEMPTQAQVNAGLRYAGGYVATGGAIIVAAGALPPDKAHAIVDAAQKVITDLQQLVGDFSLLSALVFPIIMGAVAKFGWNSARPDNQKQSLIAARPNMVVAETSSPAAAVAAANAIAAVPGVGKVVASQATADAAPSEKVVAQ